MSKLLKFPRNSPRRLREVRYTDLGLRLELRKPRAARDWLFLVVITLVPAAAFLFVLFWS